MEQDICISNNIVTFFYEDLTISSLDISIAKKCYEIIKQNFIIFDKDNIHLKNITNIIHNLPDCEEKETLKKDFLGLLINKRKKVDFELTSGLTDYHLANASLDKIYFNPKISNIEIEKMKLSLNHGIVDLEIHDCNSFVNPDINDNLKHAPSNYDLQKGIQYDLVKFLKPFLRNSKFVKFIDPYIRNYIARNHLKKIMEIIPKNAEIIIKTIPDDDVKDSNKIKKFDEIIKNRATKEEFISEIRKNKEGVEYNYFGHKERYIITENFKIYIPGGLDQFNEEGIPNISEFDDLMTLWVRFNISATLPL